MQSARFITAVFFLVLIQGLRSAVAQISPGELSRPHEFLEGITNCTKCHTIGNKITGDKCLECHSEIKDRISGGKGYHSSSAVQTKQCIECHNEHHGRNFQLVRMDTALFDHKLTGFALSNPHSHVKCSECHDSKHITDLKIREKKFTYLGIKQDCLTCHADYHQGTLSSSCLTCHGSETFKTTPAFNHDKARFRLNGKHKGVTCVKCHAVETINGTRYQEFRGVAFASCTDCHKDPHQNKFGQNCRRCHNEQSFSIISGMSRFDHSKTQFPLIDKHIEVDCKECHKTRFTDPLKHDRCTNCHQDYHKGQFARAGVSPDCSECHDIKGFTGFTYTIEQHNRSSFPLIGAHAAQPCSECHRRQPEWSFRGIGSECRDCHPDIHKTYISTKFYPDASCRVCHNQSTWKEVTFDHSKTGFQLTGAHSKAICATCHLTRSPGKPLIQRFIGLPSDCSACHSDSHQGQFDRNGVTACNNCHVTDNWKPSGFDHDKTAFKLDGKHAGVPCSGCHKPQQNGIIRYTLYKIKDYRCESCHF